MKKSKHNYYEKLFGPKWNNMKGALSGLTQFFATKSALKMMKNVFYFI